MKEKTLEYPLNYDINENNNKGDCKWQTIHKKASFEPNVA